MPLKTVSRTSGGGGGSGTVTDVNVSGGTTGLTTSGGPITTSGTITLGGVLDIDNGGTGNTLASAAFDALAPSTAKGDLIVYDGVDNVRLAVGTNGLYLKADSTTATGLKWDSVSGGGTVTSVTATSPLSSSGGATPDISLTGIIPINKGGTGETTSTNAFDALSPTTTKGDLIVNNGTDNIRLSVGTHGYVLSADSAAAAGVSWQSVSGGGGTTTFAATFDNSGTGAASGTTFNGSAARTISYNTIGAPKTDGTGASGTWSINISGNAATATSATSSGSVTNSVTFNNSGAGDASGTAFNGSAAQTISYNTLGAPKSDGTGASGTWGINISGSAATATSATSATSATTATNLASGAANQIPYQTASSTTSFLSAPVTANTFLKWNGTSIAWASIAEMTYPGSGIPNSTGTAWGTSYSTTGSGTVVALATSPSFTTPILGTPQSGNFSTGTFTWPTFNQNTTGTAAGLSSTLVVGSGGTGVTTITGLVKGNGTSAFTAAVSGTDYAPATSGTSILYGNGSGGFSNVTVGSGLSFAGGTLSSTGSGGTVTSVAMTVPSFLSVIGSPVTTSGTLAVSYSGTALPIANGGTALTTTPTNGQLLIGNGTGYSLATLTAGSNVTITNASGAITIASTGGGGGGSSVILENQRTISSNYTITDGYNGLSVGPVTINTSVGVTVGTGERWVVMNF